MFAGLPGRVKCGYPAPRSQLGSGRAGRRAV